MESAITFIFYLVILLFSVVIHEVSHGLMAYALGDPTAKYAGRLTLNPIPHIDLFGSIILPFLLFFVSGGGFVVGWAKPVPYNPYNLRNQKQGPALVGAAGPGANIILAIFFSLFIRAIPMFSSLSPDLASSLVATFSMVVFLNLGLAVFNLMPIPPLDGSKVLFAALPYQWAHVQAFLERYGILLLLIFIFFLSQILLPVIFFLFRIFTGQAAPF